MNIKAAIIAVLTAASATVALGPVPASAADIPPMPQGYPIHNLYQTCTQADAHAQGYPQWHYGETARRYLSDGVLEFKNTTSQSVDYTAEVESGTNHVISANSRAELPSGWSTTARSDIGLTTDNGWVQGETFGPIKLAPGETFRVEFGVLEKDFISMMVTCQGGFYQNMAAEAPVPQSGTRLRTSSALTAPSISRHCRFLPAHRAPTASPSTSRTTRLRGRAWRRSPTRATTGWLTP